jgi:hypothetical protein
MFRVPRTALGTELAGQYCYTDAASLIETGDHLIISLCADRDPDDHWDETTGELGSMVAARSELLAGDHRLLYLAWLMGIQWDHVDDEDPEPPVPGGLADLSGALRAIAGFLEIDEDLIAVAAEASPPLKEEPAAGLADWIATLPAAEKDKLLAMVADGQGPQVQALLLRRFRGSAPDQNEPARPARTAAQLWTAAGARRTVREESEARARRAVEERAATAKAATYNERLDHGPHRSCRDWGAGHEPLGEVHLRPPRLPRLRNHLRVGNSAVEITVAVGVRAKQPGRVLSRHQHPERRTLPLRQVAHQTQQRHRGRFHRTQRHSLLIKARALHLQRQACTAQRFGQRGALVAQRWPVLPRVLVRWLAILSEHVSAPSLSHGRHHQRPAAQPSTN